MAASPSRAVKLFGTEEPPAQTRLLRAGPLSAELDAGNLRYIRFRGREVLRAISYIVRDKYWGTYTPGIDALEVEERADAFTVTYEAHCGDGDQSFRYRARITGSAEGRLRFEATGLPDTDFLTNRTGFVVLHGVEGISGHPVEVLSVDGSRVETRFPETIDPKQPIENIRALTHQVAPGLSATCTMEGDSFEMEDQRNWTDASYKTYVRPLALPHPYVLPAGQAIEQAVELTLTGAPAVQEAAGDDDVTRVTLGNREGSLPRFAMGVEAALAGAAMERTDRLAGLTPAFLSCYLDARTDGMESLCSAQELARTLGTSLALELVVPGEQDPDAELAAAAELAARAGAEIASIAVSPAGDLEFVMPGTVFPSSEPFDRLYAAARKHFPGRPLGGGNFVYFTELNRKPPPVEALDYLCHTTCAIVHAADDRSVTETIECLPYVIASGRALAGGKEYRVGPGGLGSRTGPFGGHTTPNPHNGRVTMTRSDPRQRGLLGAAWHLGYAARMAEGGVDSVILGAPVGPFGLVHYPQETPQPWYDEAGGLYPAFHVMRALYAASGAPRRATESSSPRNLQALAFETERGLRLWLANLSGEIQSVEVAGAPAGEASAARLSEARFEACAADPHAFDAELEPCDPASLTIEPYEVVRLTFAR